MKHIVRRVESVVVVNGVKSVKKDVCVWRGVLSGTEK